MPMLAWVFLSAALSASAHDFYPIRPVRVTVRVEPDRVVADLRADSIVWIEEVTGLHPMPASGWPAETLKKVEAYANSHLLLQADGKTLAGALTQARYRQLPWEANEEGTFFLRLEYPAVAPSATLSGSARFYEEYRKELEGELGGRPLPFADGYRTFLDIPGSRAYSFELTAAAPAFSAPASDARRGVFAMTLEAVRGGLAAALGTAAGFPALLAVGLCLGGLAPSRATAALLAAAAATGFLAGARIAPPSWQLWAATLAAALAAGRGRLASGLAAAAAVSLGLAWCGVARPLLPHSALALPSALLGAVAGGAGLLTAVWLGVRAERRRLFELSESRVEELFARRVRLTATALAMVGAYGLWQSFPR